MMTKQSGDDDGPLLQMTGGIPQRGTTKLFGVDVREDSQLKLDPFLRFQPVHLCEERRT